MRCTALLVLALALVAAPSCHSTDDDSDPADRESCERVRAHLVDLRLSDATGIDVRPHREILVQSLGEPFIADCIATMKLGQAKCAAAAPNADAAAACRNAKPAQ